MKISVIIPIYNGEHYIPACLSCLQKQTYLDWEAVCVNDGSTDNSERILLGYKHLDPRIRLISQVNQGVARARESGVSEASGDYITFLDIDDTLKENALEILEREVQEYPGIGIIVAGLNIISDGKSRKGRAVGFKKLDSLSFLKRVLHGENSWELCGKMYRKDLFIPEVKVPENI
ncbi:MAG: glycosyltransferase family A protein, partial [Odoribacter sp.]